MTSHYQKAYFVLSVANVKQLPPDQGMEVAIVGRSNAGKSSVLNCLTKNKGLARVSKTPGRTQLINIFQIDDKRRLADLPGYGYAKAAPRLRREWQKLIERYFDGRQSLQGLLLVMDIRHPLKDSDYQLLEYCEHHQLPVHILLNKSDKLSKNEVLKTIKAVKAALTEFGNSVTVQSFSASKSSGLPELHALLDTWYKF